MFIAESILVIVVAAPLIFGVALGFGLGRIGMSSVCDTIETLNLQIEEISKRVDEIKSAPVFPVQTPAPAILL